MNTFLSAKIRRRWLSLLLAIGTALALILHFPAPTQAIPWRDLLFRGIQAIQLSRLSDRQEVEIGQQINAQLLSQGLELYREPGINRYVDRVGQRLAGASSRKNLPYTFQVVRDSSINAFATMGGYVYVTTGLLTAADNEAQMASVIGHEIGHIERRHLVEQMQQAAVTRGLASAAGLSRSTVAALGLELAINRPRSRKDEFEADQVGLRLLRQANYATGAMPEFMRKLLNRSSVPTFLSTHPAVPDRIAALEEAIRKNQNNVCDRDRLTPECGLNNNTYQQRVRDRLS